MASEKLMRRLFNFELRIDPERFESALVNLFYVSDTTQQETSSSSSSAFASGVVGGDGGRDSNRER